MHFVALFHSPPYQNMYETPYLRITVTECEQTIKLHTSFKFDLYTHRGIIFYNFVKEPYQPFLKLSKTNYFRNNESFEF